MKKERLLTPRFVLSTEAEIVLVVYRHLFLQDGRALIWHHHPGDPSCIIISGYYLSSYVDRDRLVMVVCSPENMEERRSIRYFLEKRIQSISPRFIFET